MIHAVYACGSKHQFQQRRVKHLSDLLATESSKGKQRPARREERNQPGEASQRRAGCDTVPRVSGRAAAGRQQAARFGTASEVTRLPQASPTTSTTAGPRTSSRCGRRPTQPATGAGGPRPGQPPAPGGAPGQQQGRQPPLQCSPGRAQPPPVTAVQPARHVATWSVHTQRLLPAAGGVRVLLTWRYPRPPPPRVCSHQRAMASTSAYVVIHCKLRCVEDGDEPCLCEPKVRAQLLSRRPTTPGQSWASHTHNARCTLPAGGQRRTCASRSGHTGARCSLGRLWVGVAGTLWR